MKDRPKFDYASWPMAPAEGFKSEGNNLWCTQSLFLETTRHSPGGIHPAPLYTLGDVEKWSDEWGIWVPSARMIYVYSSGEFDAMRKLAGSFKGWQALCSLKWFNNELINWQAEWKMREANEARTLLKSHAGVTASAAKALWDDAKGQAKGRPKKAKAEAAETDTEDDSARIVEFKRK